MRPKFPGGADFEWSNGSFEPSIDVTEPGRYVVLLLTGCDTAVVEYNVGFSAISVDILTPEQTIALGDSVLVEAVSTNTEDVTMYAWLDPQGGSITCPTCPETWVRPFNDIQYTIQAQNELGCKDTASLRIFVTKNRKVYFPNVFKPDADLVENAWFFASGDQYARLEVFSIFSRWGELMYQRRGIPFNEPRVGWDGTFDGRDALPGVYVWKANVVYLDGASFEFSGDVTLIR